MERGSDKHSARRDDELAEELDGMLGQGGGHREEWREPELSTDETDDVDPAASPTVRQPGDPASDERAVEP